MRLHYLHEAGNNKREVARNQLELLKYSGPARENVQNTKLAVKEIVRAQSVCGGSATTNAPAEVPA